jgi:GGDEF domain-containing protein
VSATDPQSTGAEPASPHGGSPWPAIARLTTAVVVVWIALGGWHLWRVDRALGAVSSIEGPAGGAGTSPGDASAGRIRHGEARAEVLRGEAGWVAAGGAAALAVAWGLAWRRWRRWQAAWHAARRIGVSAAGSASSGPADGPSPPSELRPLFAEIEAGALRLQRLLQAQASQVEALRRQAHADPVTGLPNRRRVIAELDRLLGEPGAPAGSLLLLRVLRLAAVNRALGHEATDRALAAIAELLQTYPARVTGAFCGRLNGSDFALLLPVPGVGAETARALLDALRASPAATATGLELVIGGLESSSTLDTSTALATADAALARAEHAGAWTVDIAAGSGASAGGSRAWREGISAALAAGRLRLEPFPVLGRDGDLMHLECPLRIALGPGEPYLPAARWLALAARSRLLPEVDLAGIALALDAIDADGRPRAVHVAPMSIARSSFVESVAQRLQRQPAAAQRLSIEVDAGGGERLARLLARASAAWRGTGVALGVEHAGADMQPLARIAAGVVRYVKIDARFLGGVAHDRAVREHAASLLTLLHGIGWTVAAEGVCDAADLEVLWELGFDAATGPVLPSS